MLGKDLALRIAKLGLRPFERPFIGAVLGRASVDLDALGGVSADQYRALGRLKLGRNAFGDDLRYRKNERNHHKNGAKKHLWSPGQMQREASRFCTNRSTESRTLRSSTSAVRTDDDVGALPQRPSSASAIAASGRSQRCCELWPSIFSRLREKVGRDRPPPNHAFRSSPR